MNKVKTSCWHTSGMLCYNVISYEALTFDHRTLLIGGHETTSHTIEWALLELARRPHIQSKVRAEIREREAVIRLRADATFTAADFDAMPYTVAVVKVRFSIRLSDSRIKPYTVPGSTEVPLCDPSNLSCRCERRSHPVITADNLSVG